MKSTFNICFYAKKDKQKANGAYPLFARITVDGVASRFNTKLDVLPSIWDGKMGKATGRTSEASRINRMLDDINASLNTMENPSLLDRFFTYSYPLPSIILQEPYNVQLY